MKRPYETNYISNVFDIISCLIYYIEYIRYKESCEQEGLQDKEVLRPLRKFYAPDTGLRNLEAGFVRADIGFQLESVVRIELARHGYSVAVGTLKRGEVDFVATRADQRCYVQVSQTVADENVLERELAPLRALSDAFPRLVLTTDRIGIGTTREGIRIANLVDWLLEGE